MDTLNLNIGENHRIQSSSVTKVVRVPPTSGGGRRKGASLGRGYGRTSRQHVPSTSSHPPPTSILVLVPESPLEINSSSVPCSEKLS